MASERATTEGVLSSAGDWLVQQCPHGCIHVHVIQLHCGNQDRVALRYVVPATGVKAAAKNPAGANMGNVHRF